MTKQFFELIPFPVHRLPKFKITGSVVYEEGVLTVRYVLSGPIDQVLFPGLDPRPGRRDGLWQATCFEFFLAFPDQPQYWEFNLSPSGDWNAYRMDAYRRISLQEEELIQSPRLDIRKDPNCFHLEAVVDLRPIAGNKEKLQMGVSSVVQTVDGHASYWSLIHPGPQADFHHRESFILALEG